MADEDESRRMVARRAQRRSGERSSDLARELMKASDALVGRLELDEELREVIADARRITSLVARRRAERALAGHLRRVDIAGVERALAVARDNRGPDAARLHAAERWRTRMLDEGITAVAELPGGDPEHVFPGLIAQARRERETGRPAGAQRALFRRIIDRLDAVEAEAQAAAAHPDDPDDPQA
jgi:ribosome-associated protein